MGRPSKGEFLNSQFTANPTTVAIDNAASTRNSSALASGMYLLYASTATFWLQGTSTVTATTSSIPLPASTYFGPIWVDSASTAYVANRAASGTGTLYLIPIDVSAAS